MVEREKQNITLDVLISLWDLDASDFSKQDARS